MLKFLLYALVLWFLFIGFTNAVCVFGGFFIFCVLPRLCKKLLKLLRYLFKKFLALLVFISPVFYTCYYTILKTFHKKSIREPFDFGHYAVDNPKEATLLILQMIFVMFLPVVLLYTVDFTPVLYKLVLLSNKTGLFLFIELSIIDTIVHFYEFVYSSICCACGAIDFVYHYSRFPNEVLYFKRCCLYLFMSHGIRLFSEGVFFVLFFNFLAVIFHCLLLWNFFVGAYLYFIESYRGWPLFRALFWEDSDSSLYALAAVFMFLIILL